MPLIGIISKENDSNFIRNEINKNVDKNNFEVININKNSIQNIKNIKFDILVVSESIDEFLKNSKYLQEILRKSNYIIINSDIKNNISFLKNKEVNIITYGFNAKATVTISSIREENIMICIQRSIRSERNIIIEEQEINIKIEKNNVNKLYNVLIIFTILTLYGENLKKI